jgi:hypothetical protein
VGSLFDEPDERRRDELTRRGWTFVPLHGTTYWRRPWDWMLVTEEAAFAWLREQEESDRDRT